MAKTGGSQPNYTQWDAPTLPPRVPLDAFPPPPLTTETASPLPGYPYQDSSPRRKAPTTKRFAQRGRTMRRVLLALLLVALIATGLLAYRLWDFGSAISTQGPLTTQTRYMTSGERINLLIMGYGGGQHAGPYLTDSMVVLSLNLKDEATTMISVPRDLWVQVPPDSGNYAKLNTAYQDGLEHGYNGASAGAAAGGTEAARKVSQVLGMPVQYWLTIDFSGFRSLIDAMGGVDINVPIGWTATYPRNNDQDGLTGYETVTFKAGWQHMNGVRALEYARERYVTSPASEASDFARSARQLLLIHAIVDRARSLSALPHALDVMNALQQTMYTNLSLADLGFMTKQLDVAHATRIGLSNQNVLVDAMSDDGQDILEPANGDWSVIQQYVAAHIKP